ncbi:reverse transcriptase domain-containing protein [Empedobacter brevis]
MSTELPDWFKIKGYTHLSPTIKLSDSKRIIRQIKNPNYVAKYAFYPLIHKIIKERKYKQADPSKHLTKGRRHAHLCIKTNQSLKTQKERPLHYASHMDSLIYGYYANLINERYEQILKTQPSLNDAVLAYRKIETFEGSGVGKSNIHFAKECFDVITNYNSTCEEVGVLAFDLKSFFSTLDHQILKRTWAKLLEKNELPKDHYNVFKACTKFNYVLLDDLRIGQKQLGRRRNGFNESKLASIRKHKGYKCFFKDNEEFRNEIQQGNLKIYNNPFYREIENINKYKSNTRKINVGIPQGLPISATLANLYLLEFDQKIIEFLKIFNGVYRRYSDDLLVVCKRSDMDQIESFFYSLIEDYKITISKEKTERFLFKTIEYNLQKQLRLECFKLSSENIATKSCLSYLGFEFRGYHTGIKSTNLAKYYRKMISSAKKKANRANKIHLFDPSIKRVIYLNQLKKITVLPIKLQTLENIEDKNIKRKYSLLKYNSSKGFYEYIHYTPNPDKMKNKSNYHSYIRRCCNVFETDTFNRQLKKNRMIMHKAVYYHLNK